MARSGSCELRSTGACWLFGHGGGVDRALVGSKMEHGQGEEMIHIWQEGALTFARSSLHLGIRIIGLQRACMVPNLALLCQGFAILPSAIRLFVAAKQLVDYKPSWPNEESSKHALCRFYE